MVSRTQFAITGEDTRYFLNGALFVLKTDSMDLVATDGHRLALATTPREPGGQNAPAGIQCAESDGLEVFLATLPSFSCMIPGRGRLLQASSATLIDPHR